MLVKTFGSAVFGIDATTITMEVDVTTGIKFMLVGLPDSAVKESQQRIESALRLNGYKWPKQKIIINMAHCLISAKKALPTIFRWPRQCWPLRGRSTLHCFRNTF